MRLCSSVSKSMITTRSVHAHATAYGRKSGANCDTCGQQFSGKTAYLVEDVDDTRPLSLKGYLSMSCKSCIVELHGDQVTFIRSIETE